MNSQWLALGLSILVVLAGTAVNIFVIGRFIGRSSGALDNAATTLKKVEERLEAVEGRADKNDRDIDVLERRVFNIEKAMDKMWELRDSFIKLSNTVELTTKAAQDAMDRLARGQSVIERQLANIAKDGLEFRRTGPGEDHQ